GGTPDPNCVEELPIRSQLKDLQSLCGIVRAPYLRHRSLAATTGPISRQCSPPSSLPSPSQFHRRPPSPPAPRLRTFLPAPRQPVASSPSAPSPALASFPGNTSKTPCTLLAASAARLGVRPGASWGERSPFRRTPGCRSCARGNSC